MIKSWYNQYKPYMGKPLNTVPMKYLYWMFGQKRPKWRNAVAEINRRRNIIEFTDDIIEIARIRLLDRS